MVMIENFKLVVFERYALFEGRSGRAEFWWYVLAHIIVSVVLSLLGQAWGGFYVLGFLWWLALIVPPLAVGVRRLHDAGNSGWFLLIWLIPVIGWIILIVMFAQESATEVETHADGRAQGDVSAAAGNLNRRSRKTAQRAEMDELRVAVGAGREFQ
jgi:uncharacterized membrane protein YhaH (DUF805 family)